MAEDGFGVGSRGNGRKERGKGGKEWHAKCVETDGENLRKNSLWMVNGDTGWEEQPEVRLENEIRRVVGGLWLGSCA